MAVASVDRLLTWGATNSMWIFPMATSCCGIEFMAAAASRVDLDRMGAIVRGTPRQCDVMVVAGTITAAATTGPASGPQPASSTPATSLKVTRCWFSVSSLARLLPKERAWLLLPWACRIMNSRIAPKKISGSRLTSRPSQLVNCGGSLTR